MASASELETGAPSPLYRKLRPGPNGPGPEMVARHQRARLYGAMVEMVVARGYAATSIKGVCALAGVSRRTFYDLFADRDECMLVAFEQSVGLAGEQAGEAWAAHERWADRVRSA